MPNPMLLVYGFLDIAMVSAAVGGMLWYTERRGRRLVDAASST